MTNVPSGWYQNPHNSAEEMYWDGAAWSGASRRGAVTDPRETLDPARAVDDSVVDDATMMRVPGGAHTAQRALTHDQLLAFDPPEFDDFLRPQQLQPAQPQFEQLQFDQPNADQAARPQGNPFALAALILGCCGVVLTAIPFLIGLVVGGLPDLLAIVFGVMGVLRGRRLHGKGIIPALLGGVLGCLGLIAMTFGAGTIW